MSRSVLALLLLCAAAAVAAPHVQNPAAPRDGLQTLELTERWHRGHDDDEFIFGAVRTVERGPGGRLYLLDTQLAQVFVFEADGTLAGTLSREGEGPGETRRPEDLVVFPDGSLGIAQYINGRIVRIAADGTPRGTLMPPGQVDGGMFSIRRVRHRGGSFVINGVRVSPSDDGMVRTQFLTRCDEEGEPLVEFLSRQAASNLMRDGWVEKDNYFPSHERWDIDHRGRVLAATERNVYRVTVYEPDGSVAFTFGRDAEPWQRTEAEKQEIRDALVVLRDGERIRVDVQVEDAAPLIQEVHVMDDGEIWVLPTRGLRDRPAGVMQIWDVFDAEGVFVRQVAALCEGDPEEDRLFLLDAGRALLVRGAVQARRGAFGGSRAEEADVASHDVKLLTW